MASAVLHHLHRLFRRPAADGPSDGRLLERFAADRDPEAFADLVRRHGPLVLNVCRRVLGDSHDAEDAFQASFLVLARRAAAVRKHESLASFLHGVARRCALRLRTDLAKRRRHERQAVTPQTDDPADLTWNEVRQAVDEELARLPEKYRAPLVLCYLQGKTQREAARELGWGEGKLRGRLDRGRERLRARLTRRGLAPTAVLAAATLTPQGASAAVAPALAKSTVTAALTPASSAAAALARTVLRTTLLTRLATAAGILLTLGVAAGLGSALLRTPAAVVENSSEDPQKDQQRRGDGVPAHVDRQGDPLPAGAVARLGTVRFRHDTWLSAFALAPDGRTLASAAGRFICLWDPATGKERRRLDGREDSFMCLAWSADGKTLAAGANDNSVRLWDAAAGKEMRRLEGHTGDVRRGNAGVVAVAFALGDTTVISAGMDKTVRLWDAASGKERRHLGEYRAVLRALAVSPDGRTLAVVAGDYNKPGELVLWDLAAGRQVWRLPQAMELACLAFSPDGKTLAAGGVSGDKVGELRLWEVASRRELRSFRGQREGVLGVAFSPDGRLLASAGMDKTARVWDVDTARQVRRFEAPALLYKVAFTSSGKTLVAQGPEHVLRFWGLGGREAFAFEGHRQGVIGATFSVDGKRLLTRSQDEVHLWDMVTRTELARFNVVSHGGWAVTAFFDPNGNALAGGTGSGRLRLYDVATRKEVAALQKGVYLSCQPSPDGKTLAVADQEDRNVRLWNAVAGSVRLWDAVAGKEVRRLEAAPQFVSGMAFSPDSTRLALCSGTDVFVYLYDAATGKLVQKIGPHPGGMTAVAFSPDGRCVAAASMADTVHLWEVASGQERLRISHGGPVVTTLTLAPDSRMLAAGYDGLHFKGGPNGRTVAILPEERDKVRLWDTADGRQLHRFVGHGGGVTTLAFTPDGRVLLSGCHDTTALLWDVAPILDKAGPPRAGLSAAGLEALWTDLQSADAAKAYQAVRRLAATPGQGVALVGKRLRPVVTADPKRLSRLLDNLDSDSFATREKAAQELAELGESAGGALRKALEGRPSPEVRRQIEQLLGPLDGANHMATLRGIELLELAGTAEARRILEALAGGASSARRTQEAAAALARLSRRQGP
jgi:RNA polymerase sigma factor (sigma-70 family)